MRPPSGSKRATVHDVAREAGVSAMTVSRVFSGGGPVADATRERVLEVAQRLGYRPNRAARVLTQTRTCTLGLVMNYGLVFGEVPGGAEELARERGYHVLFTPPRGEAALEREGLEALLQWQVDGLLILSSSDMTEHAHLRELHQSGVPIVTINRYCEEMGFWRLFFDYEGAAFSTVRRLLQAGHRHIGYVGGGPEHPQVTVQERVRGYRAALREAGLWNAAAEAFGGTTSEDGEALTGQLLEHLPETTALLAVNDRAAAGALRALRRRGRRVPGETAVVSFDDTEIARCTDPPLTSVRPGAYEAGRTGCELLIAQIEGTGQKPGMLRLPSELVIRPSCRLR